MLNSTSTSARSPAYTSPRKLEQLAKQREEARQYRLREMENADD